VNSHQDVATVRPRRRPRRRTMARPMRKPLSAYSALSGEWHPSKNHPLTPKDVSSGSGKKVWWRCRKNPKHVWQAIICNRIRQRACPICLGRLVTPTTSLAALHPKLASQWDIQRKARPGNRVHGKTGCPYCSGRNATTRNNLALAYPQIAKEWHATKNRDLRPEECTPQSDKNVWWQCKKDHSHEWQAIIGNRTRLGRGCPFCSGRRITPKTSLGAVIPRLARDWHPSRNGELTPHQVSRYSHRAVWWQCPKVAKHVWKAKIANRSNGSGCPFCYGQSRKKT